MAGSVRAVIFDVDGVLVRSMERHYEAYRKVFSLLGEKIEPLEVYRNEGRRSREVIQALASDRGIDLPQARLEELSRRKQETFVAFGPQPLYPGVQDLLDRLRVKGLRLAAVTGTNRLNVENHLRGLLDRFDAIVTADDVRHTKPDPEPYQAALARLGIPPEDAVVVENAPLGIRSAKAAGLRVVAIASTLPPEDLAGADRVVATVADAGNVLEGWI